MNYKTLYIVHCIDTEGPLNETIEATFERLENLFGIKMAPSKKHLEKIQNMEFDFNGKEAAIAKCFSPELLNYNRNWGDIEFMLDRALSSDFRNQMLDDWEQGWIYSWHCMDHVDYLDNPREKPIGYNVVFDFYRQKLNETGSHQDEINWHYHPLSLSRRPMYSATSYANNYYHLLQILCRRILDRGWFPVVNRPGFHAERPDSHAFLEQWIPFDYANQQYIEPTEQPDLQGGRFGDWRRSPATWRGYHPSHDDYQVPGNCRRTIFRCLNIGTRFNKLTVAHVREAFAEAYDKGKAILAFANHDYRDICKDVDHVRELLGIAGKDFPDVKIKFSGAEAAAQALSESNYIDPLEMVLKVEEREVNVSVSKGRIFGPQPFLAIKSRDGNYYHDNFDEVIPG